jgi:hypothetical protein
MLCFGDSLTVQCTISVTIHIFEPFFIERTFKNRISSKPPSHLPTASHALLLLLLLLLLPLLLLLLLSLVSLLR